MSRAVRRGQPLAALVLVLFGWVAVRAAIWEPLAVALDVGGSPPGLLAEHSPPVIKALPRSKAGAAVVFAPRDPAPAAMASEAREARTEWPVVTPLAPLAAPAPLAMPAIPDAAGPRAAPLSPRVAAGHQMLWLAAMAQLPLPAVVFENRNTPDKPGRSLDRASAAPATPLRRWSADGWLLLRRGGAGSAPAGFAAPTYGASQLGAVIRYRLAPESARNPALYLRASSAVHAPHGEEVAAGFAVRPVGKLPILAMAELRATRLTSGTKLRPAAALVSEFPPLGLPLGARAEAYLQAGYVGGPGATAFADGQLSVTRRLARFGPTDLSAGAGVWGGAQQGSSRLDIGPTASLRLPLGGSLGSASARLSADWRFRVGGSAAPTSGPAITLSAGF